MRAAVAGVGHRQAGKLQIGALNVLLFAWQGLGTSHFTLVSSG
jgi:hypothetical protein